MPHEEYKGRLEAELKKVKAELSTIAAENPETGDWVALPPTDEMGNADANERADVTEEWGARRSLMSSLEPRYNNISRALKKIEDGTFGICEISGEPIEPERLAAIPTARTNIANIEKEAELPL